MNRSSDVSPCGFEFRSSIPVLRMSDDAKSSIVGILFEVHSAFSIGFTVSIDLEQRNGSDPKQPGEFLGGKGRGT